MVMYEVRIDEGHQRFSTRKRLAIMLIRDNRMYIAEPLVFRELKDGEIDLEATFDPKSNIELEQFFRAFIQAGEAIGIKSEGESRLRGVLEAQGDHLKDLRLLVHLPAGATLGKP